MRYILAIKRSPGGFELIRVNEQKDANREPKVGSKVIYSCQLRSDFPADLFPDAIVREFYSRSLPADDQLVIREAESIIKKAFSRFGLVIKSEARYEGSEDRPEGSAIRNEDHPRTEIKEAKRDVWSLPGNERGEGQPELTVGEERAEGQPEVSLGERAEGHRAVRGEGVENEGREEGKAPAEPEIKEHNFEFDVAQQLPGNLAWQGLIRNVLAELKNPIRKSDDIFEERGTIINRYIAAIKSYIGKEGLNSIYTECLLGKMYQHLLIFHQTAGSSFSYFEETTTMAIQHFENALAIIPNDQSYKNIQDDLRGILALNYKNLIIHLEKTQGYSDKKNKAKARLEELLTVEGGFSSRQRIHNEIKQDRFFSASRMYGMAPASNPPNTPSEWMVHRLVEILNRYPEGGSKTQDIINLRDKFDEIIKKIDEKYFRVGVQGIKLLLMEKERGLSMPPKEQAELKTLQIKCETEKFQELFKLVLDYFNIRLNNYCHRTIGSNRLPEEYIAKLNNEGGAHLLQRMLAVWINDMYKHYEVLLPPHKRVPVEAIVSLRLHNFDTPPPLVFEAKGLRHS